MAEVSLELHMLSGPSQCCSHGTCGKAGTCDITGGPKPEAPPPSTRDPPLFVPSLRLSYTYIHIALNLDHMSVCFFVKEQNCF